MNTLLRLLTCTLLSISATSSIAQNLVWQNFTDSIPTLSSPRSADLNGDGILDIVIGGGTDGEFSHNGIMAFDGNDGSLLWKRSAPNEIFTSAIFQDITGDGIPDVFLGGRDAQLYAINGSDGSLIWEYYTDGGDPSDQGLWNFYSAQFIPDADGDMIPDLLLANGGDHSLPLWETNRPPGHLMVVSSLTGDLIAMAVVPDSNETYCSPLVINLQGDGNLWVLYGTGGESLGGSFYAVPLSDLLNNTLENSVQLATHPTRGFIAPAAVHTSSNGIGYDIIIQGFGGTIYKVNGATLAVEWATSVPGTESSAEAVIGNFYGGDHIPDVFAVLFKGTLTSYTDFYQVMINGADGSIQFMDSLGSIHFASANAVDLNNDGRDEVIVSVNYYEAGYFHHKLLSIDFQNDQITQIHEDQAGVNIGSTPLITDIDNNGFLDIIYVVKKDSLNPMGWKGIYLNRYETNSIIPNAGIAWGSYIGTESDGIYTYSPVNCGTGSVISGGNLSQPSCNLASDGSLSTSVNAANGPHTYLWSTGEVTPSISGLAAGVYSVRVTNALGCFENYTTSLQDPYFLSFGGIVSPTCPGDSDGMVTVSSSGCPCMFNLCVFNWDNGLTAAHNNQASAGYNYVSITHPDGCIVQDSVFVPEPLAVVIDTIVNNVLCPNAADGEITLITPALYTATFDWSNGMSTPLITGLEPGDYSVVVTDDRPCNQTLFFTITEPEPLELDFSVAQISCHGNNDGSFNLEASGGTPNYIYFVNEVANSQQEYNGLSAGNYEVFAEDENGCLSASDMIVISEPSSIESTIEATVESTPGALDGTAEITVTGGTPPYAILWSDPNAQTENLAVYLTNGWYYATITDANGCQSIDSVFINTLSLHEEQQSLLIVYPNPAKDFIAISHPKFKAYFLYDTQGKLISTGEENSIDVRSISNGIYLLKVVAGVSEMNTKVVLER
jgi:hypothetical protein